eukprot:GEMP01052008.1.p1 GENE.GEMP01052008.1~~GEMP01052008.1.p1  ORF type:complete len:146 (+),score=44.15 GEMP01052008.1:155-592(+)
MIAGPQRDSSSPHVVRPASVSVPIPCQSNQLPSADVFTLRDDDDLPPLLDLAEIPAAQRLYGKERECDCDDSSSAESSCPMTKEETVVALQRLSAYSISHPQFPARAQSPGSASMVSKNCMCCCVRDEWKDDLTLIEDAPLLQHP